MIKNYFKTAWRSLLRNKLYTAINIFGLSLRVSACLIIYLITSFELSYDTFHSGKDRIYRIVGSIQDPEGKTDKMADIIPVLPMTARNELTGFETVSAFYNYYAKVKVVNGDNVQKKFDSPKEGEEVSPVIITDPQYFDIFKYQWLAGNAATALNEPFKVVLSENEAYKYFGAVSPHDVIGKDVIYNDSLHLTVSGIVKDWNRNSDFGFKDYISFATIQHSFLKNNIDLNSWGMWDFDSQGYVKLAPGVTPAQVERQFPQFVKKHIKMPPTFKAVLSLQPLADVHFNTIYQDAYSRQAHLPTLYALMGIAAFILIIAAINFINLSTAQSLRRAKEVGVRKVLGSSKANLTIQFLAETFFVTIAAVIISVLITNPIISLFRSFIPNGVVLNLFNLPTVLFLISVIIFTSLFAGFYPAMVLSSYLPALSLKGEGQQKLNGKSYLRKTLIVFQFTVSLVFIIGTIVIGNQIHFILNKDLGFNKDAIITLQTSWDNKVNQEDAFFDKARQIPGVQLVARDNTTPAAKQHAGTYIDNKGPGGSKVDASFNFCDESYVPLFGLKIVAGRNLLPSDTLKEFLVNETCAKALGFRKPSDAIGKIVKSGFGGAKRPIVGVIKDFHSQSLHESINPFFLCSIKNNERAVSIKLATQGKQVDDFKSTIAQIEKAWIKIYPHEKFEYRFFDETIANLYDKEQKTAWLMNAAMSIAIFISCMGLFGLATFTAQQRIKEIGIRKVLGASVMSVVTMLSKDFLVLVIIALLLASPVAYYFMNIWLQDFAYRVNISGWVFLLSGSAAIVIATLTISFQSVKAALANPVKSLRSE